MLNGNPIHQIMMGTIALGVFARADEPSLFEQRQSEKVRGAIDDYLTGEAKARRFSGVCLVAKAGKPIFRKAYGFSDWIKQTPNTPETPFMIFSVTKQFTAAMILRLEEQGKLSVDDPVSKYLENWPADWSAVKVHHLLSHSAGIEIDTLYYWLVKYHPQFWPLKDEQPPTFEPKKLLSKPGTVFRYSNAGYTVLTLIAAKAGGKSFDRLMRDDVFVPIGMKNTGLEGFDFCPKRARGHGLSATDATYLEQKTIDIVGAGDVVSTVDDMLKWDNALSTDTFLSAVSKKRMFTPYVKGKLGGFGYGWLIREVGGRPLHVFSGSGAGFTAYVIRRPDSRMYIVVLSNQDYSTPFPHGMKVLEIAEELLDAPIR